MKNGNNAVDLDDFWAELISKSEWAKNEAYKNPSEFKNLNILGSRKNTIPVPPEKKFGQPQNIIFKKTKKAIIFLILKDILTGVFVILLIAIAIISFMLLEGYWHFKFG